MEPEGSLPHSQQSATCPYPKPDGFRPCSPSHFSKIHFNIILLSVPGSSKWPSVRFPHQNPVRVSPLSHTCYIPRPNHSSWFHHPGNIWWTVQCLKLLGSFCPCYLVPLKCKYPPQRSILDTALAYVSPSIWDTRFHTYTKQQAKLYFCIS